MPSSSVGNGTCVPDGNAEPEHVEFYLNLKNLTITDPRAARQQVKSLMDAGPSEIRKVLKRASVPGEGRVRHLIANALRLHPERVRVVDIFEKWLEMETDAFARRATEEALRGMGQSKLTGSSEGDGSPTTSELVARTYHQVADQLRHQVRNGLLEVRTPLRELGYIAGSLPDGDPMRTRLEKEILSARGALRSTGLLVAFEEGDKDEYFLWRPVAICDWIRGYASRFGRTSPVPPSFRLHGTPDIDSLTVWANEYYLDIVFRNIWNNARQAVGNTCVVIANATVGTRQLSLLISDNGPGFSSEASELVFESYYSTKGTGRGRGLLELDEAMRELNGSAELICVSLKEFRLMLKFPLKVL